MYIDLLFTEDWAITSVTEDALPNQSTCVRNLLRSIITADPYSISHRNIYFSLIISLRVFICQLMSVKSEVH